VIPPQPLPDPPGLPGRWGVLAVTCLMSSVVWWLALVIATSRHRLAANGHKQGTLLRRHDAGHGGTECQGMRGWNPGAGLVRRGVLVQPICNRTMKDRITPTVTRRRVSPAQG
jgi:hypothetical protein